jgi:hypothetical protein
MPAKSVFGAVLAVVFLAAAVAMPAPASAAPATDACAMITQDQMTKIFGVQVGAGTYTAPGFTKTCTWSTAQGPAPRIHTITLMLQTSDSFEAAKQMQQAGKFQVESVSGLGDDAYYSSVGDRITSLIVKKGGVAFKIAMYGDFPLDKKKTMSKAMALQVLSKL